MTWLRESRDLVEGVMSCGCQGLPGEECDAIFRIWDIQIRQEKNTDLRICVHTCPENVCESCALEKRDAGCVKTEKRVKTNVMAQVQASS